jgi:hypothetical protein
MNEQELKDLYKNYTKFIKLFELEYDNSFVRVKNLIATKLANLITSEEN